MPNSVLRDITRAKLEHPFNTHQHGLDMKTTLIALTAALLSISLSAAAWDGVEAESGNDIEIETGNLVRSGESIEYYDYEEGEYKSVTVEDINRYGSTVEIEVTNDDTGETVILEMEDQ